MTYPMLIRRMFAGLMLFAFAGLFIACTRTYIVSGYITNIKNDKPVAGLKVNMLVYDGFKDDSANREVAAIVGTTTNQQGYYYLEYSGKGIDETSIYLSDDLCDEVFSYIVEEKNIAKREEEMNFRIDPIDARLKVILINQSGTANPLYLRVDCDVLGEKGIYCCALYNKNQLPPGQSDTLVFRASGDQFVGVYWDTIPFPDWNASFVDSVFCPVDEVSPFVIVY